MEYVPGEPVTPFADRDRLTIPDRLELFQQICQAINHAHMKAVIHRDIKPGNVLAYMHDGKPTAKVIDFGIAKVLTGDRLTEQTFNSSRGQVIGSDRVDEPGTGRGDRRHRHPHGRLFPGRAALRTAVRSEAVRFEDAGQSGRRGDQANYSKGGAGPAQHSSASSGKRRRRSPRLAGVDRRFGRRFRQELEWIPLMAMRKERERRYASPLQLSEDLDDS